jgi:20S proteasome alpha/beta subunit
MTTICWNGRVVAADRQADNGGYKFTVSKIFKLKDGGVAGIAGDFSSGLKVVDWLNGAEKPLFDKEDSFVVMVIRGKECFVYEPTLMPIKVDQPFFAIGSGAHFAMAALHFGKSPKVAIETAALFDSGTGMGYEEIVIGKK